jgi:hypothetical protein
LLEHGGGRTCALNFSEYRNYATTAEEAYHMRDAGEQIRSALAEQGYAPR